MHRTFISLILLAASMAMATVAQAGNASAPAKQQACPSQDEPGTGRRIVQNQALGKVLDKNPLGIAMARRAKKKHLDDDNDCPGS